MISVDRLAVRAVSARPPMGAELVWAAIDAMGVVVVRHLARLALPALAVLASTVVLTDIATAVVGVRLFARVACYTLHSVRRI